MSEDDILVTKVKSRLSTWHLAFYIWYTVFAILSIGGIVSSACSAADLLGHGKTYGIIATVAFTIITTIQPHEQFQRHSQAWRVLDDALFKFENKFIDPASLIDALRQGDLINSGKEDKKTGVSLRKNRR